MAQFFVQVLVLDQTKTVAECAQQLLYAAKESGGNPKATHVHADIDDSAEAMETSISEMLTSIEKLNPKMPVQRIVNCITEAIFTVDDYRPGSRQGQGPEDGTSFVLFQVCGNIFFLLMTVFSVTQIPLAYREGKWGNSFCNSTTYFVMEMPLYVTTA